MLLDAIYFAKEIIMIHINIKDKQSCEDDCFPGSDTIQFGRTVTENIIPHTACLKEILTMIKVFHFKITTSFHHKNLDYFLHILSRTILQHKQHLCLGSS